MSSGLTERLRSSLDNSIRFIERCMSPEGFWSDFLTLAGESTYWVTGYVGVALARGFVPEGGEGARKRMLSLVGSHLLENQQEEGGWGYCAGVPADADSTSWCLLFLSTLWLPSRDPLERAASFLLKHQSPRDGGFRTYAAPRLIGRYMSLSETVSFQGWASSQTCVTAASSQALVKAGASRGIEQSMGYIRRAQTSEGYWNAYWWTDNLYPTALCGEALAAKENLERAGEEAQRDAARLALAQHWTERVQRPDGSWRAQRQSSAGDHGWPFSTALALKTLMLGPGSGLDGAAAIERGVEWLLGCQSPDGGWESHHTLRIPHPSSIDPWNQPGWNEDGRAVGAAIRDQRRLYTTATVFCALSEFERRRSGAGEREGLS